jgi:RNA recognition motif-containing protein
VTNLPFSLNDDGLFNLFKNTGAKSARVHQKRFGQKSRGVGFVEYENEQQQLSAIEKMNGFMVEDGPDRDPRKITVVVSQSHPPTEKNDNNQQ